MIIFFDLLAAGLGCFAVAFFIHSEMRREQRAFERQIRAHELLRASLNSFQQRVPKPRRQTTTAKGKSKL